MTKQPDRPYSLVIDDTFRGRFVTADDAKRELYRLEALSKRRGQSRLAGAKIYKRRDNPGEQQP